MTEKQFRWILKKGLDFNLFFTLQHIKSAKTEPKTLGWCMLLERKAYIDQDNNLTDLGENLLQDYNNIVEDKPKSSFNLSVWCTNLAEKLKKELTSHNYKANLKGFGGTPFLPDAVDIERHLKYFWRYYKDYKDYTKIEKILLSHVKDCCKKNAFSPAVKYFIYKNGVNTTSLGSLYNTFEDNTKTYDGFNL